jgi:hypothetical protein
LQCRHYCLLVGFTWTEAKNLLFFKELSVSRKVISDWDIVEVKERGGEGGNKIFQMYIKHSLSILYHPTTMEVVSCTEMPRSK